MSNQIMNMPAPIAAPGGSMVATLVKRISDARQRRAKYRACIAELDSCSDRVLRDLGIFRSDIKYIARQTVYGPPSDGVESD